MTAVCNPLIRGCLAQPRKKFENEGRDSVAPVTPQSEPSFPMYLMPPTEQRRGGRANELETIALSGKHLDYLGQIARQLNPDMPATFGLPHLIRTILDRVEASGIDLTEACSEEDIARLAAGPLGGNPSRRRLRAKRPSERLFSLSSAARRSGRSSLPEKDQRHSGRTPRSGRG